MADAQTAPAADPDGPPAAAPAPWKAALARQAWAVGMRVLVPAWLLRLAWRGRREPLYRHAGWQRLGLGLPAVEPGAVWVHAVSLGETRAAAALIAALREAEPGLRLVLTHGTATGWAAGCGLLRECDVQCWLPLDTPGATRRFLRAMRPALGVVMETEVWPCLMHQARREGVPMVLANARLSERSLRRGERLRPLMAPAAAAFAAVLAQTEADARRLRRIGAGPVQVAGNLKFDMQPPEALQATGRAWRQAQPAARAVVMAAATREGEESPLLQAWGERRVAMGAGRAAPLLLLVPRHPQRFDEVAQAVQAQGLSLSRRSGFADAPTAADWAADVWLGDSLGEMPMYYAMADVALLGGSFEPLGGQNLIEALACGCPVVVGPHAFNFSEAVRLAVEGGAARQVPTFMAGLDAAAQWLADPEARAAVSRQARAVCRAHRGAAALQAGAALALRRTAMA